MEKETGRIEAFSDGVFAVAITLLVLDLHVPLEKDLTKTLPEAGKLDSLLAALLGEWPTLGAYVISFLTILVMWLNHNRLFEQIQRKDQWLSIYNGLLLMVVTLIPFPTALLADYVETPHAKIAAAFYCGFNLLMAVAFNLLWNHAAANARLLADDHDRHKVQTITAQYRLGPVLYAVLFGLAFVNVPLCLSLALALAVFFTLPERSPQKTEASQRK